MHRRHGRHATRARRDLTVDIGVHEVGVHELGAEATDLGHQLRDQQRVGVVPAPLDDHVDAGAAHLLDEPVAVADLEHAHPHVDSTRLERGEQREEMALRATDPLDSLDMQDAHRVRPRP